MSHRVGIFGGAFDPVHNGHVEAVRSFLSSGLIDSLEVIPAADPPHKRGDRLTLFRHRYKMLQIAFRSLQERVRVNDLEATLESPNYTFRTIVHLQEQHPDRIYFLCLGEDSLAGFSGWYRFEDILDRVPLMVVTRPGSDSSKLKPEILEKSIFVDHHPVDTSSTRFRQFKLNHVDPKTGENPLPQGVYDYIVENRLYQFQS